MFCSFVFCQWPDRLRPLSYAIVQRVFFSLFTTSLPQLPILSTNPRSSVPLRLSSRKDFLHIILLRSLYTSSLIIKLPCSILPSLNSTCYFLLNYYQMIMFYSFSLYMYTLCSIFEPYIWLHSDYKCQKLTTCLLQPSPLSPKDLAQCYTPCRH